MSYPVELKYTREHEWVKLEGENAYVGITEYAAHSLGDIVYVELPAEGDEFASGDVLANVESVKAVAEVYCPLAGKVLKANAALEDAPETLNADPYGAWIAYMSVEEMGEFMDAEAYAQFVESQG